MAGRREARDRDDVEREEHGGHEGEEVSPAKADREVVSEREQANAEDAQGRGHEVRRARALAGHEPVDEGDHHAVGGGEKGVAPGSGVGEADVLDHEGSAGKKPQHGAGAQMARVHVRANPLPEQRAHDEGGKEEPDEHEPAGRQNVKRALDDDERATPDGGRAGKGELPNSDWYVLLINHASDYTADGKFLPLNVTFWRNLP